MSSALDLLHQAMKAAKEELRLLKKGDEEGAVRIARDRERLMRESWNLRDSSVEAEMRKSLKQLQQLHESVLGEARRQRDKVREELLEVRGRRKRTVAYGAQRNKREVTASRFVDRTS